MVHRLIAVFLLLLGLTGNAWSQQQRPRIHPRLQPLVEQPAAGIPEILRGPLGAHQGTLRIRGQEALDLFLRTTASREQLEALGIKVRTLREGRATVTVPVAALPALASRPDVQLITLPKPLRLNLDRSVLETGASYIRSQSAGVFSGSTGANVIVGVIDSGIDFDHPDFTDSSGNTRILYLWDQTSSSGTAPAAYAYGAEWTSTDIDGGLCTEADDPDAWGHGTHVTGIAAGNGSAPDASGSSYTYTGMAPNASIIFVKSDLDDTHLIDAMNFIFDKADDLGLPAVINMSLGGHVGAHDGTDPVEQEIDSLVNAQAGRAVVVSAGNEGGDDIHAEVQARNAMSVLGPAFTIPAYTPNSFQYNDVAVVAGYYPSTDDLTVHLWSPTGLHYSASLTASSCTTSGGADGTVEFCNNSTSSLGQGTADREIVITIYDGVAADPPASGTWQMALSGNTVAGSGWADFWVVSILGSGGDIAEFTTHVDEEETVGIPGTAEDAITVGAYVTKTCWDSIDGNSYSYSSAPDLGDIAEFSSLGPTRDGRSKPEIAAPGMGIVSSLAQEVTSSVLDAYEADTWHMLLQGTSQAAPHVTGAVALFFEEDPARTVSDIRSLLRDNARQDDWTESYDQPSLILGMTKNYAFGNGKLNVGSWAWNDPYETNDTYSTAREVVSGATIGGYMDTATDYDLFELEALATGDTVDISLTSLPDNYRLNLLRAMTVFGSCSSPLLVSSASSDNAGTADESISYTVAAFLVPRYVRVASSAGGYSASTPYSLRAVITRPETSSAHSSTATAQVLPEHEEFKVSGSISVLGQQDFYKLAASSGQTITAAAGFLRAVQILDSTGALLAGGLVTTNYSVPVIPIGVTRTYYVVVKNGPVGNYTLTTTVN